VNPTPGSGTYVYRVKATNSYGSSTYRTGGNCVVSLGPCRTVTAEDTTAAAGDIDVPIPITVNDATGIAGFDITMTYDPTVITATGAQTTTLTNGFSIIANTSTPGTIVISAARATAITSGSGAIVEVLIDVIGPEGATSPENLVIVQLNNEAGSPIPVCDPLVDGIFTIDDCGLCGDINDDTLINSADAILALRYAVGLDSCGDACQCWRSDCNCDGLHNSADAILILRCAVGLGCPSCCQ